MPPKVIKAANKKRIIIKIAKTLTNTMQNREYTLNGSGLKK